MKNQSLFTRVVSPVVKLVKSFNPANVMCAYCHHEDLPEHFFKTRPAGLLMCNNVQACEARGYWRDHQKGLPARKLPERISRA